MALRFSVITITFNAQKYLSETLNSVAGQQKSTFEHLLWDGGSKDGTLDIARKFSHLKVIEGKDRGIGDAMNKASLYARGEFLLFLHADDMLAHSHVLRMIEGVLVLHPKTQWLYGRAHVIDENGHFLRSTPYEPFTFKRLKKYNYVTHPASIVSAALFKKAGGFDARLRYCMDYDLWLKAAKLCTPLSVSTPLAIFREHGGSLSTNEPLGVADEAYYVRNRHINEPYERLRSYLTWRKRRKRFFN